LGQGKGNYGEQGGGWMAKKRKKRKTIKIFLAFKRGENTKKGVAPNR